MQNYRLSGMGNTPSDEKEREANERKSNTVFNSDFYQFCDGMPSVLYMYCLLLLCDAGGPARCVEAAPAAGPAG